MAVKAKEGDVCIRPIVELHKRSDDVPAASHRPGNKFVVHKYKAKSGHASRAGIMRVVSWMYLFKNSKPKKGMFASVP